MISTLIVCQCRATHHQAFLAVSGTIQQSFVCCCVHAENNKVSVTDLGSTNGTYIDDEELAPLRAVEMSVGTEITFGKASALI